MLACRHSDGWASVAVTCKLFVIRFAVRSVDIIDAFSSIVFYLSISLSSASSCEVKCVGLGDMADAGNTSKVR